MSPAKKVVWKKLRSHRGSCAGITARMKGVLGAEDALDDFLELGEYLIHDERWGDGIPDDQRWVEATAPAIDFLLSNTPKAAYPARALAVVAELVGAPHDRLWTAPLGESVPADIVETLDRQFSVLEDAIASEDAATRAAAAMVLAVVDSDRTDDARALLRARLNDDDVVPVRASALLGLARIGDASDQERIEQLAHDDDTPARLRAAAALGLLRTTPSRGIDSVRSAVECLLSIDFDGDAAEPLVWFQCGVRVPDRPNRAARTVRSAWALELIAQHADAWPDWREAIVAIGCSTASPLARRAVSDLLLLNDLPRLDSRGLLLPEELSAEQRSLLERIGDKWLCVDPRGLPAAGPTRMRYLGFADPSLMEKPFPIEVDGKTVERPLAWTEGRPGTDESTLLHELDLPAAQRWRAAAELYAGMFHVSGTRIADDPDEERLWEEAAVDPELPKIAPAVLDEIAAWVTEARAQLYPKPIDQLTGNMLFIPIARAGVRIKPEWEVLLPRRLPVSDDRAIIECLEEDRREGWLTANPQSADRLATYVELIPGEEYVRTRLELIAKKKKAGKLRPKLAAFDDRVRELAKTLPRFAKAVKQVDKANA